MNDIELKPCPFCGEKDDIDFGLFCTGTMRGFDYVQCQNCGAEIQEVHNPNDYISAATLWNRRADND